jgi:YidC/Oxa1 family membrane protein insertase
VRALLLPLAIRVLRAGRAREALAPQIARLRARHADDPARLLKEIHAVHEQAGVSQLAGIGPALAQAPVMLVLYRLGHVPIIAGTQNVVWAAGLFGAPLAGQAPAVVASAGLLSGPGLVVAGLLLAALALAITSARQATARLRVAAAGSEVPSSHVFLARVLPYGTLAAAAFVPLAVMLYLVTSTAWTVAERAWLPRFG